MAGRFVRLLERKGKLFMNLNRLYLEYMFKLSQPEKVIYKWILIVAGTIASVAVLASANAWSVILCFALGWFAHKKYEVKERAKRKKAKKA
jgi:hypothetical protein